MPRATGRSPPEALQKPSRTLPEPSVDPKYPMPTKSPSVMGIFISLIKALMSLSSEPVGTLIVKEFFSLDRSLVRMALDTLSPAMSRRRAGVL